MTEIIATAATTHFIEQADLNVSSPRELLESIAEQANGERATPFTVEHDPFCMPLGKTVYAWVEPYEGEFALMSRIYIEDNPQEVVHEGSQTVWMCLNFEDAPRPFTRRTVDEDDSEVKMIVDLTSFDGAEHSDEFLRDLQIIDSNVSLRPDRRFSLELDPLVRFVLSDPVVYGILTSAGLWLLRRGEKFTSYTVDETLRKIGDEISDSWSRKLIGFFKAYKNHQSEDTRPILSQTFIAMDDIDLVLLAKMERDEEHPGIILEKLTMEMTKYADLLEDAEEITFNRVGIDDWELLYFKTRSGRVIGTKECYERTLQRNSGNRGVSLGMTAGKRGPQRDKSN